MRRRRCPPTHEFVIGAHYERISPATWPAGALLHEQVIGLSSTTVRFDAVIMGSRAPRRTDGLACLAATGDRRLSPLSRSQGTPRTKNQCRYFESVPLLRTSFMKPVDPEDLVVAVRHTIGA